MHKGACVAYEEAEKKLKAVSTFVSSTSNNVLKYKNSLSGKAPALGRLVCNTGKQKLVIQSLHRFFSFL